jgi:hypothetical protein
VSERELAPGPHEQTHEKKHSKLKMAPASPEGLVQPYLTFSADGTLGRVRTASLLEAVSRVGSRNCSEGASGGKRKNEEDKRAQGRDGIVKSTILAQSELSLVCQSPYPLQQPCKLASPNRESGLLFLLGGFTGLQMAADPERLRMRAQKFGSSLPATTAPAAASSVGAVSVGAGAGSNGAADGGGGGAPPAVAPLAATLTERIQYVFVP